MQSITSKDNQIIKEVKSLHTAKGRREKKRYMIEGKRIMEQALAFRAPFCYAVVEEGKEGQYKSILGQLEEVQIPLYRVPGWLMERICDAQTPQGILGVLKRRETTPEYHGPALALDGIADPGNLGTMLRTAQAFGVKDVLLSQSCADAESPKCMRSGMGAHFALNLKRTEHLAEGIQEYRTAGYTAVGGHLHGTPCLKKQEGRPYLVVVGSEAEGMTLEVEKACDALYCIPMQNGAESLNAAVAAGILMYAFFC